MKGMGSSVKGMGSSVKGMGSSVKGMGSSVKAALVYDPEECILYRTDVNIGRPTF